MKELTSKERMTRILKRQPVDRVGLFESFWEETHSKWVADGFVREDETLEDHFGLDIRLSGPFQYAANLDKIEEIIEDDGKTILIRNGNGAILRWWKGKVGTPEHVDFLVKDRETWNEHLRPHLANPDNYERRINSQNYCIVREKCARENIFFCLACLNVFELMHPICGHEYMLMGMALDPDWVSDMCTVLTDMLINCCEILFDKHGLPDGVWGYEDMGFKNKPFMSPKMYKEIIWPAHKRMIDYWHSKGLPVIIHSCGFVEALVPDMIEAGMDCLQAMEVKAGMDLPMLKKMYGDKIAFMGGMDVRPMVANDLGGIKAELDKKLPVAMAGGGYTLMSDHSIPAQTNYETYKFFVDRGLEMGRY